MKDTIYREDAIGACAYETIECYEARKAIRALPSTDRPRGEWIMDEHPYRDIRFKCSNCGESVPWDYEHGIDLVDKYRTCPFCDARMKGADDE